MPMAKMDICEIIGDDDDGERIKTTSVDVDQREVKKWKIGDEVEVRIRGTVGMLETPPSDLNNKESADREYSSIGLRVSSREIIRRKGEQERGIDELADD